ncbi:MAG: DUF350 domain-containing protein [Candidatus Magnetomorum sp.]|nr:DUF350 domain-containing protein [Candidatus Magnetomorum sp.]
MIIDKIFTSGILIIAFYLIFYIGKKVHDLIHHSYDLNDELVEKDNPALALSVAGYYAGLVFSLGGTIVGQSNGLIADLIDMTIYGTVAIILINLSWFVCDRLILRHFHVIDELIRDQNQGTGAVSCGVSIASGLIIYGAVSGEGGSVWTAIIFWSIGQAMLILAGWIYNIMIPYSLHGEIERDNVAAGVSFAGALIAMGIVVGLSAEGDFDSWSDDLPRFIYISMIGLCLLPIVRFLTDKILFPTRSISDEIANQEVPNVGVAYIEAFSYIAAAFIIYWTI